MAWRQFYPKFQRVRILQSSGLLRSVRYFYTDVLGLPVSFILTPENGTDVEEDLRAMKITNWKSRTEDKLAWKKIVEQAKTHPGL
jgi:hypothetical protein